MKTQAQSLSVKRAEVEFHSFASLGEPERAIAAYAEENVRRSGIIRNHLSMIGSMSPFLEIGSNVGHTSYMLCNEFGASGFALDISADALRYGSILQQRWNLSRVPIRITGDAVDLPFRDGSIRFVMAFQVLSQFLDIESVFLEVKRVLAPGGVFLFSEEPLKRLLSLRLYRCPYYETMKPWERKLSDWGLLGYLVRDVIGAHQEESFGIRQNHTMRLQDWHALITRHFVEKEYELFVPERGWGERVVKRAAIRLDPYRSAWRAAKLLGGTLAAVCRKAGTPGDEGADLAHFQNLLRCPDCHGGLASTGDGLACAACGFEAQNQEGVYNLLPSAERRELYPGERADIADFSQPGHEKQLGSGWHDLEGVFGNKYRWVGESASLVLRRVHSGAQRLRIRGHAHENSFRQGQPVRIEVIVNGRKSGSWTLERTGLFVLEADVPDEAEYEVQLLCSPVWRPPNDERSCSVNFSMIRLIPQER
ncbi:MAG: class I SAM-dependent methyltransferase [Bryobacteraceae bacterium]|nr:class I SAM-dependent methyltransferase [Bryobacterales bacterium]NUN01717.1 class I SAM-dependent methyltransferase [Bryobacteraceae bacterium]